MSLKVEAREITDTYACIVVNDISPPFVNAVRRALIADVPKMAIQDVEFHLGSIRDETGKEYESIAPIFDEVIAQRLGLVPIPTDLEIFNFRKDCVCEDAGCANCQLMYTLNKKGSHEEGVDSITVYSDELQLVKQSVKGIKSKDYEDTFKITDKIPIVKLNKNQAMLVYAKAELGRGRDHAKWQPTTGVGYSYYPIIEISGKCDHGGQCVSACPRDCLAFEKGKVTVKDLESCTLCLACVESCECDSIKISSDESKVIFRFETDGAIKAKDALLYAIKQVAEDFVKFEEAFSAGLKGEKGKEKPMAYTGKEEEE